MRILSTQATAGAPVDGALKRRQIAAFLADTSFEVTPGAADKLGNFASLLPCGTSVAITFLPGANWRDSVRVAARLVREGMVPVPHVAARSLRDDADLDGFGRALAEEAGVTRALVIAGSVASPLGAFLSTMDVLRTGLLQRHGIRRISVAGHPEGSLDIAPSLLDRAIKEKNELAEQGDVEIEIITQFCFDPDMVIAWEERLRAAGNRLPVRVGLPGPATLRSLLAFAAACGVGPSMGLLRQRAGSVVKLMTVTTPDRMVMALVQQVATDPATRIVGAHMFPFGGLTRSATWVRDVRHRQIRFTGDGFVAG